MRPTVTDSAKTVAERRRELLRRRIAENGLAAEPSARSVDLRAGERYPLSPGQRRLWFVQTMDPADTALNICVGYRLTGSVEPGRLRAAFDDVVARHAVLRTTYRADADGESYQEFRDDGEISWHEQDLTDVSERDRDRRVAALAREEFGRPFDLTVDLPLRVRMLRTGAAEFVLLLVIHHICWDDDCWEVFFDDLAAAYRGRRPHGGAAQYVAVEVLGSPADPDEVDLDYWRNSLRPLPEPLELPGSPVTNRSRRAERRSRTLPASLVGRADSFARQHATAPFTVLLAAFGVLVHRYTGASDFLVAVPVTERPAAADRAIGYFGNTLLLRITLAPRETFAALADRLRETCLDGFAHQSAGIDRVVSAVQPQRTPGRDGLDQLVAVGFSIRKSVRGLAFDDIVAGQLDLHAVTAQLPLSLSIVLDPDDASIEFEYQTEALSGALVDQLLDHYRRLLDRALTDPGCPVGRLDMLDDAERADLAARSHGEWVATPATTLVALLERTAARTPGATAVVSEAGESTYAELHARANRLARWLIRAGIGTEDVVGLRMASSVEFVVAALAVLKSGAAYLPIDPGYPDDRIQYLVTDSRPAMVIDPAQFDAAERIAAELPDIVITDADRIRRLRPANLAYVIYTSGSTGRPKGVAVSHRAVAEHIDGFAAEWSMTAEDRLLQSSSVSFDASVADIFCTLCLGATLVVPEPGMLQDIDRLTDLIERHRITVLHMVPSLLNTLLQLPDDRRWHRLRHLPVGGEALPGQVAEQFTDRFNAELRNHYGPTEAVICSTHKTVDRPCGAGSVPIGVLNRNVSAYVLDRELQPVPAEVIGELYLGGAQLARGYLGRPALTADRFVADPFTPGQRLYRSGDLVRRNRAGELEFVGRADQQVKIRGFRIELGEVESAIASHPAVRQCVVVAVATGLGTTLAAYLVPVTELDPAAVRAHVAAVLPDHLVPNAFAVIPAIPLTVSGKPDTSALPAPAPVAQQRHREPATPTEQGICAIFSRLFDRDPVGADDSFFALGGHSLLAVRLVAQLRAEFGADLTVRAVFDTPTPAGLATAVAERIRAESADRGPQRPPLTRSVRPDRIPLSYSQLAGWFQYRIGGGRDAFNMPLALRISGPVDPGVLRRAVNDVLAHHDALRTTFGEQDGVPYQTVQPVGEVDLPVRHVAEDRLGEAIRELRGQVLTPESGLPIRASLLAVDRQTHVLLLIVHHLVGDHASLGVVLDDLVAAYRARLSGRPPKLAAPPVTFADHVRWQHDTFDAPGEWGSAELAYWREKLAGLPDQVAVPADRPRRAVPGQRGEVAGFTLTAAERAALVRLAEDTGATEFMVYHAAVAALLHMLTGGTDIAVGSPAAARVDPATTDLVGLFANAVVLRTDLSGDPSPRSLLARSRETTLDAFAHQEVPIERLVDIVKPVRLAFRNPLYQTMIHFRGDDWTLTARDLSGTGETTATPLRTDFDGALLDLDVALDVTSDGGLDVQLVADADLYLPQTVRRVADALRSILDAFAEHPDRPLSGVDLPEVTPAGPTVETEPKTDLRRPAPDRCAETERVLIAVLEELLEITGVGPDDNFFALGGDSIISIKWAAAATARGSALTPAMVFEHLTIGELAAAVTAAGDTSSTAAGDPAAPDRTYAPMSASGLSDDTLARLTATWPGQS